MKNTVFKTLFEARAILFAEKELILDEWVNEEQCATILGRHEIDRDIFFELYA